MKRFFFHPITLVCLIFIIVLAGWLLLLPSQLAGKIKQIVETRTGRSFEISGGAGYGFSPQIGMNLFDVTFAGSSALAQPVLKSKALFIPLTLGSVFGGVDSSTMLTFSEADVTVAFNEQGHANLLINQNPEASKTDVNAPDLPPVSVKIESGTFHYNDARDGTAIVLPQFSGVFDFGGDGGLTAVGSTEINDRHANFSGTLKSMARAVEDGSPLDFNLDSEGHNFTFSGRLATQGSLNLAGQGSVETSDAQKLFKWLGVDIKALPAQLKFSVDGPFESQGSTFALKKSALQFYDMKAAGDILFSTLSGRKNLALQLDFDSLHVPGASKTTSWSEIPFDISALQNIDAQFKISTPKLAVGPANLGTSEIEGTLKNSVLNSNFTSETLNISTLKVDASQTPPTFDMTLTTANADAKAVLPALTGQSGLSGLVTMTANLKAHGKSQAEMISTLGGDVGAGAESGAFIGNGTKIDFTKFSMHSTVEDGIATLGETHLTLGDQMAAASGEIDLLRKNLSMSVEPIAKQKILLNGAWDAPKISAIAPTLH